MAPFIAAAICIGVTAIVATKVDMNTFFMRFFRDLSRSKARRRLYGNKHALMPMLLGIEKPIEIKSREEADSDAVTITLEELELYNGDDDSPLYISIKGRVYDVSAGEKYYGEFGNYHDFVGKDATRAFATGCLKEECISSSTEGLSEKELKEIDRWIELYETHDKYTFIGYLVDDPVDAVLAAAQDDDDDDEEEKEEEETFEDTEEEQILN